MIAFLFYIQFKLFSIRLAGEWIQDEISRSVASSKRTVVVLSDHFLDSMWGRHEFRTAYQQLLIDKQKRLIVIIKGDFPPLYKMDDELKVWSAWYIQFSPIYTGFLNYNANVTYLELFSNEYLSGVERSLVLETASIRTSAQKNVVHKWASV